MRSAPPKLGFGLLALLNIDVNPDPILHRSIGRSERLGTAEEPAVIAFGVTNANTHVTRRARLQIIRRGPPSFLLIVRMQKRDMRVPRCARVGSEPKRMILW